MPQAFGLSTTPRARLGVGGFIGIKRGGVGSEVKVFFVGGNGILELFVRGFAG